MGDGVNQERGGWNEPRCARTGDSGRPLEARSVESRAPARERRLAGVRRTDGPLRAACLLLLGIAVTAVASTSAVGHGRSGGGMHVGLDGVVPTGGVGMSSFASPSRAPAAAPTPTGEAAPPPLSTLPDFQREIERIVESTDLRGGTVGISVVDAASGTTLVDVRAEQAFIPASNMKLLTSGVALQMLGPDFKFRTRLLQQGRDLVVVGDGDPAFGDPALLDATAIDGSVGIDAEDLLAVWADAVVQAGVTEVDTLVVDDRLFERILVHPEWPRDQLNRRYCAEVSALNFHANVLHYFPSPSGDGRAMPGPSVPRADWIVVSSRATSRSGGDNTAWIGRVASTNRMTLYGNVRVRYRVPVPVTIHDPAAFFGDLLADRLRDRGVRVGSIRLATATDPKFEGASIAPTVATALATVLERCNTDSHNLAAECLLKRSVVAAGQEPGTWAAGAAVIRHLVRERLGQPSLDTRLQVADGSGLSRGNRVPPALFTGWLRSFELDPALGPLLRASMAEAGRSGTMTRRLRGLPTDARVIAKTGYIDRVSCLSGFIDAGERTLCFSIMVNDFRGSSAPARGLQDRVVERLANGLVGVE